LGRSGLDWGDLGLLGRLGSLLLRDSLPQHFERLALEFRAGGLRTELPGRCHSQNGDH
jgi:hypothetical protein